MINRKLELFFGIGWIVLFIGHIIIIAKGERTFWDGLGWLLFILVMFSRNMERYLEARAQE